MFENVGLEVPHTKRSHGRTDGHRDHSTQEHCKISRGRRAVWALAPSYWNQKYSRLCSAPYSWTFRGKKFSNMSRYVGIHSNCDSTLFRKVRPSDTYDDTAHATVTFGLWRGRARSSWGFSATQQRNVRLFTVPERWKWASLLLHRMPVGGRAARILLQHFPKSKELRHVSCWTCRRQLGRSPHCSHVFGCSRICGTSVWLSLQCKSCCPCSLNPQPNRFLVLNTFISM